MPVFDNILQAIGRTPLVRLHKLVGPRDAAVYAKCEFMNPGGAVKDRMALYILDKAEREGRIKPGATIVENTSGNTGMGVALWAAVKGYRCVFTMPDKMSSEKVNALKAFGAEVVVTPTNVAAEDPRSYYETAKRIHRETPGSFMLNQYHNPDNIEAHYRLTGPELEDDLRKAGLTLDAFVAGLGTGGTMSGAGKYLKEKFPQAKNVGADPDGSVYLDYFKTGKLVQPHVSTSRASWRRGGWRARRACSREDRPVRPCTSPSSWPRRWARARPSWSSCPTAARATSPSSIRTSG